MKSHEWSNAIYLLLGMFDGAMMMWYLMWTRSRNLQASYNKLSKLNDEVMSSFDKFIVDTKDLAKWVQDASIKIREYLISMKPPPNIPPQFKN